LAAASPDFGPLAASYDRLRPLDENWWRLFELLVEEGSLLGRRVLDVGCGTGRLAAALAERGARVWGVDPSQEMLAQARQNAPRSAAFKRARAEALPFKDAWFDRAVMRLVVHLVDRGEAFREVARVLVPRGLALVATFAPEHFHRFWLSSIFPQVEAIDLARFPSSDELEADLKQAGLVPVRAVVLEQVGHLSREEALERIRGRYISTLTLLDDDAFAAGLERAERELPDEIETRLSWAILVAERK
jgi:ubiquinone/menaquinone biosynthesis C-methylase UbiE